MIHRAAPLADLLPVFTPGDWSISLDAESGMFVLIVGEDEIYLAESHIATIPGSRPDVAMNAMAAPALFRSLLDAAKEIDCHLKSGNADADAREVFVKVCSALGAGYSGNCSKPCYSMEVVSQLHGEYTLFDADEQVAHVSGGLGAYEDGCFESEANANLISASPLLVEAAEFVRKAFSPRSMFHPASARVVTLGTLDRLTSALTQAQMLVQSAREAADTDVALLTSESNGMPVEKAAPRSSMRG